VVDLNKNFTHVQSFNNWRNLGCFVFGKCGKIFPRMEIAFSAARIILRTLTLEREPRASVNPRGFL